MKYTDYNAMVQLSRKNEALKGMHLIYSFKVVSTNNKNLQPKFLIQVLIFRPITDIKESSLSAQYARVVPTKGKKHSCHT